MQCLFFAIFCALIHTEGHLHCNKSMKNKRNSMPLTFAGTKILSGQTFFLYAPTEQKCSRENLQLKTCLILLSSLRKKIPELTHGSFIICAKVEGWRRKRVLTNRLYGGQFGWKSICCGVHSWPHTQGTYRISYQQIKGKGKGWSGYRKKIQKRKKVKGGRMAVRDYLWEWVRKWKRKRGK